MKTRLLLIDDCPNIRTLMAAVVERFCDDDIEFRACERLDEGLGALKTFQPDAVLLDHWLKPHGMSNRTVPALRQAGFDGPLFLWSSQDKQSLGPAAAGLDITCAVSKLDYTGLDLRKLVNHIRRAVNAGTTRSQAVGAARAGESRAHVGL